MIGRVKSLKVGSDTCPSQAYRKIDPYPKLTVKQLSCSDDLGNAVSARIELRGPFSLALALSCFQRFKNCPVSWLGLKVIIKKRWSWRSTFNLCLLIVGVVYPAALVWKPPKSYSFQRLSA